MELVTTFVMQLQLTEGQSHADGVRVTLQSWLIPSQYTKTAYLGHAIQNWLSPSLGAVITHYTV